MRVPILFRCIMTYILGIRAPYALFSIHISWLPLPVVSNHFYMWWIFDLFIFPKQRSRFGYCIWRDDFLRFHRQGNNKTARKTEILFFDSSICGNAMLSEHLSLDVGHNIMRKLAPTWKLSTFIIEFCLQKGHLGPIFFLAAWFRTPHTRIWLNQRLAFRFRRPCP